MATKTSLKERHKANTIQELSELRLSPHQIRMLWDLVKNPHHTGPIIEESLDYMMEILHQNMEFDEAADRRLTQEGQVSV